MNHASPHLDDTPPEAAAPAPDPAPEPGASHESSEQQVRTGIAVGGSVFGGVTVHLETQNEAADQVIKPTLRTEGSYPAEDVCSRIEAFVEPTSYARCREVLAGRLLLLRCRRGSGSTTAAFALLAEVCGTDRVSALDPVRAAQASWRPSNGRGYLAQGLSADAADGLGEVALTALADRLKECDAHLVISVDAGLRMPWETRRWQVRHEAPEPREVAAARLHRMVSHRELTEQQLKTALGLLDDVSFRAHLASGQLPAAGVDVAEELREVATGARTLAEAGESLRLSGAESAVRTLERVRRDADGLALAATVALLEHHDRTVIQHCGARLRTLLTERAGGTGTAGPTGSTAAGPSSAAAEQPGRQTADLLGPSFEERLARVDAQVLPRTAVNTGWHRIWTAPVAFRGRHRAEAVLERLWLEHEGMAGTLQRWIAELDYRPRVDLYAGPALGRVLRRATGTGALRQLGPLAQSPQRWQRRLVAYALGEAAQEPVLAGAVREQLWSWSRSSNPRLCCTVAETCAGAYGLARPTTALRLLGSVLSGRDGPAEPSVQSAVSHAFGVLLTEEANREPVLERLVSWLAEPDGTARGRYAFDAVQVLARDGFPDSPRSGITKLSLPGLAVTDPGPLVSLLAPALRDPAMHGALAAGLVAAEHTDDPEEREATRALLRALARTCRDERGLRALLITLHRTRATGHPNGGSSA